MDSFKVKTYMTADIRQNAKQIILKPPPIPG